METTENAANVAANSAYPKQNQIQRGLPNCLNQNIGWKAQQTLSEVGVSGCGVTYQGS